MKKLIVLCLLGLFLFSTQALAQPREEKITISAREIVERLTRLEEGQKALNQRFDDMNKRFDDMNKRFDDMNKRFDMLMWFIGLFVTVVLVILGAVVRIQWQMQKRMTAVEKEVSLLKEMFMKTQDYMKLLIEGIKPPKDIM